MSADLDLMPDQAAPIVFDDIPPTAAAPQKPQERRAVARLIEYAVGRYVALSPYATVEVVERPDIVEIPGAAPHAMGLFHWRERWLPVIDLAQLLHGLPRPDAHQLPYVLVVAYQAAPGEALSHGAIALNVLPEFGAVTDAQQCALPTDSPRWRSLALSCFAYEDQAVVILDAGRIFGQIHEPLSS